jgi:transposase
MRRAAQARADFLAADAGAGDEDIATGVGVGESTIYRTKRRFVVGNLEEALSEEPRPGASRKLSGKEEALLVAPTCSNPPEGRARWTLELLADELVRLTEHDSISRETVRRKAWKGSVCRRASGCRRTPWRHCWRHGTMGQAAANEPDGAEMRPARSAMGPLVIMQFSPMQVTS